MTQNLVYAGTALGPDNVRLEDGLAGFSQSADGTYSVAGLKVDDPLAALTFTEMSQFYAEEWACSRRRTFTGYLTNMRVAREMYITGAGRRYDFDLVDLNYLLHVQLLRGSSAKRPAETGNQRLTWLLASIGMSGIIYDHGLIASIVDNFDEADYTGQYADSVLADLCVSSSTEIGRIFFVYRDDTTGQPSLFLDLPTAATYTSTLRISNVLSDLDSVTVQPYRDEGLELSGEDIYCAVLFKYKTGQIYSHNATTHATYFAGQGLHREAVFETTRVGSLATATRHASQFLAAHNGTLDTITCTVRLAPDKVNLIEAGMRLSCKFSHFPAPYNAFGYLRVASRTVALTQNTDATYDVQLRLTNRSITPGGTGSTGDFPHPPPGPPAIVQKKFAILDAGGDITLDSAPTAGNWLIVGASARGGAVTLEGAFTAHPHGNITPGSDQGAMGYRLVGAGESATLPVVTGAGGYAQVWEVSGIDGTLDTSSFADVDTATQPASINAGTLSPSSGVPAIMFMFLVMHCSDWGGNGATSMSTPAGWTLDGEYEVTNNGDLHPNVQADSRIETSTSGTYGTTSTIAGAGFNFGGWGGLALAFAGSATLNPPSPGQWVGIDPPEIVTMTGDSGTTAFPFADGSLRVFVDNVEQTSKLLSQDGATGDFQLGFTPTPTEVTTVQYQGR